MIDLHIYLHFDASIVNKIQDDKGGETIIKHLQFIIDRSLCEPGCKLYFDDASRIKFFDDCRLLEDPEYLGGFGAYNLEEVINLLLTEPGVCSWESRSLFKSQDPKYYYRQWLNASEQAIEQFPDVLKEIFERISLTATPQNKCLFLNFIRSYQTEDKVTVLKSCYDCDAQTVRIEHVSDFIGLDTWLNSTHATRIFNHNDNRHVIGHPDYISPKSPILGGMGGKPHLSGFLGNAISDVNRGKQLYNQDTTNDCFVRFEDENAGNQYHGYHLVDPKTSIRDAKAEDNMSDRLKKLMEYRLSQN